MAAASRVFGNLMVYSVKSNLTDRHVDDDGLAYEGAMSKLAGVSLFRFKPPKSTPQRCAEYRGVVRPYTKFQTGICEPIPRSHFPVVRPHAKTTPMVRFGWTQQLSSTWCQQTGRGVALGTGSGEWHIFVWAPLSRCCSKIWPSGDVRTVYIHSTDNAQVNISRPRLSAIAASPVSTPTPILNEGTRWSNI